MPLDKETEAAKATIAAWLETATPDERIEMENELFRPYCRHCGAADPGCQCWNDE